MKKKLLSIFLSVLIISVCAGCGAENTSGDTVSGDMTVDTVSGDMTVDTVSEDITVSEEENSLSENDTDSEENSVENTENPEVDSEEDSEETTADDDTEDTADGAVDDTEEISDDSSEEPVAEPQAIYTYTEMTATLYATQTVNVRNLPDTTGETLGSLSTNQEVTVTAQCNETGWYMFDYNGQVAFASNNYLSETPVEVSQENAGASAPAPDTSALPSFPYPLHTWTLQTSAEGCPIYVIYSTHDNIYDIRWGTPTATPDIFETGDRDLLYETVLSYAREYHCYFHIVHSVSEVGTYAEGTIYQCISGAHYVTKEACHVYDPDTCLVGTVD